MDIATKREYFLASAEELNLKKTFECGQCFRWESDESGVYTGVAYGRALRLREDSRKIVCTSNEADLQFWRFYFDLETNYDEKSLPFSELPYLKKCAEFGSGIRILRQEPWETLCSFIISQCNNIPRIKKIISTLCSLYGDELEYGMNSFPSAEKIARLSKKDLAPLKCGYRADYILDAACKVCDGTLDLEALFDMNTDEAFQKVKQINGVGDKVANCFMLYGLHKMDRFPIDVWIKRALKEHFPKNFDPSELGSYAGLAQQYIFYFARTHGNMT